MNLSLEFEEWSAEKTSLVTMLWTEKGNEQLVKVLIKEIINIRKQKKKKGLKIEH